MRTKIEQDHKIYKRALEREGKFWKGQTVDPVVGNYPTALQAYKDEVENGGAGRTQYLKKLGPFKRGISIGCGSANVEIALMKQGIVHEFTFVDVSQESLEMLEKSLTPALKKRAHILSQDINFLDLPENTYDFVFCANVLHHIINLEHVLLQLNKAVTENGIIFIDDFVGEDRFQFSDERIALINGVGKLASSHSKVPFTPMHRTSRNALINSCPFESIRSSDLHDLLKQLWGKTTVREGTYGAVSSWALVVLQIKQQTKKQREQLSHALDIFVAVDKLVMQHKWLTPLYISGTYKKNLKPPEWNVKKWSSTELKHHLPVRMFDERFAYNIGSHLRAALGEGAIYQLLKRTYLRFRG